MSKQDQFPWDVLKAECLRLVCSQVVQASNHDGSFTAPARKDEMIQFLQSVSGRGLDAAIKLAAKNRTPAKSTPATPKSSPRKRRISHARRDTDGNDTNEDGEEEPSDETYNTRYKGVKRVKVRADPPVKSSRSPRKAARPRGRPRKSAQATDDNDDDDAEEEATASDQPPAVKRGRGRPKKSGASESVKPPSQRQVFDGVVLEKRNTPAQPASAPSPAEEGEEDGDGEMEEEDLTLAAINGNGNEDLSSLGGSNKENDPNEAFKYTGPDENDADRDADGDPDETRNEV
ncbi:hypothetical protein M413DRAFT_443290 [Hebeloma cylindrosporum]|uniref:Uncharacterized protein n=1 Tax=Hebeloma cylindrosporum TaxID=76867 RepID=A0A0C3CKF7_HEBCY|nr:hypothetical protein M413DRAFT_443290 [Hebeloma cylindrosporum h7]